MDWLPRLNLPDDWETWSPVFFGPTKMREARRRRSMIPLVSRQMYESQRKSVAGAVANSSRRKAARRH